MSSQQIIVYGGGGFAREVAWLVQSCTTADINYDVVCFVDDDPSLHGRLLNDLPILSLDNARDRFDSALIVMAVGAPKTRESMVRKASNSGFQFATVIHPHVERSKWIEIGTGTVICAGNILTTNITLGAHVQINLDCTIGHDVVMGDYTTLAPGVHISGWVHIGRRVYFGTGANVINGTQDHPLIIADDAVVGAGACVTKSIAAGMTVVGVPARPLQR